MPHRQRLMRMGARFGAAANDPIVPHPGDDLLLETGEFLLLETGETLVLES